MALPVKNSSAVELALVGIILVVALMLFFNQLQDQPGQPQIPAVENVRPAAKFVPVKKLIFTLRGELPDPKAEYVVALFPWPKQNGSNPDGIGTYHINALEKNGKAFFFDILPGYYVVALISEKTGLFCSNDQWLLLGTTPFAEINYPIDILCPQKPRPFFVKRAFILPHVTF